MGILFDIIKLALFISFIIFHLMYGIKPYHAIYYIIKDTIKKDRTKYPFFGFWLYSGLGGTGKSVSIIEYAERMKAKYPKLWVVSGLKEYINADEYIYKWEDILEVQNPNGKEYGCLILFDEIQLTLSSENWKNAPENLLEYISQQRKFFKHIVATSQVFERVNIKLREQTNYVVEVSNIGKRWIFIKAFHTEDYLTNAELKDNGVRKRKRAWRYNFIATDELRSKYNTYETQVDLRQNKKRTIDLEKLEEILQTQ